MPEYPATVNKCPSCGHVTVDPPKGLEPGVEHRLVLRMDSDETATWIVDEPREQRATAR